MPIPHARRRNKRQNGGKRVLVEAPPMPALEGEAAAEWQRVVPELEQIGLLAVVDRSVLIRYCRAWADWCELDAKIAETGMIVRGRRDTIIRNPMWLMRSDAEQTLSDLGKQLGLTPAARLRAGVVHDQPEEDEDQTAPTAIADYRKRAGL